MDPEPLLGILPDPSFDHIVHPLHRADDIDGPIRLARRFDRVGEFATKAVVRQADDAGAVNRAFELSREPCPGAPQAPAADGT